MEFAKAQKYSARISDKFFVTDNQKFLYVKLELVQPDRISYAAGQYVSIRVNGVGERRSYSIVSTPDDNHGFHLLAEMVEDGKGSGFLKNVSIGDTVEVLGPLGRFVVNDSSRTNNLLFVATGSGIAPVYAMINDLLINKRESRQIRLHWGLKNEANMFWFDNFERLMEQYPNFVFDPVLSQPDSDWSLCSGHVQDCLKRDFPSTSEGLKGWEGYVCGNPVMVEQVSTLLVELGMKSESVYHEKFT